ncbi:MAG: SDR family NAD(P)-dependent oxidoreductase [Verrucomicrobiota bacterium]
MIEGKRALVTGASSGIGRAIAQSLQENGAKVIGCARREERLQELGCEYVVADFLENDQVASAVQCAAEFHGGLDIIVNSAGIGRQSALLDGDPKDWGEMWQVNVQALALATREALKHFPESGGQVVNLSSMSGHRVPGKGGFYSATKFAVRAMTEALRQELRIAGDKTRVSSISPGFVDTELLDEYFQSGGTDKYSVVEFPILQPADVAAAVMHQLSAPAHVDITDILLRPTDQAT